MSQENLSAATSSQQAVSSVRSLIEILRGRRSRRFAPGMKIESGPFAYTSRHAPAPLTEAEEAALAFAACGVTGYALADLAYGKGQGGQMLAGLLRRTVASPDVINIGISPRGFCRQRT